MFYSAKLYQEAYDEAVRHNDESIAEIEKFKKELEGVKECLEENQKHLFQHVMSPLAGGKALIRGKLIHTNEVFVFLGDKWFLRTSATRAIEICKRKIERCNENIAEIEQLTNRFSSNVEKSEEYEIFPHEDIREIIEPYDEENEKQWREQHRQKVLEYKKQELVERSRQTDEDIFKKLDEQIEKESKSNFDISDEQTASSDDSEDSEPESDLEIENLRKQCQNIELNEIPTLVNGDDETLPDRITKKRVSFSDSDELKCYSLSESIDAVDTNIILFKHSDREPSYHLNDSGQINSPSDIHRLLLRSFNPKSILKKDIHDSAAKNDLAPDKPKLAAKEVIVGDIIERTSEELPTVQKLTRPMSKFRKSRVENV